MRKFFIGLLIFLAVVFYAHIGHEQQAEYESDIRSEGYHEGYDEGYSDGYREAYWDIRDEADGYVSWASSYARDGYRELELIFDEFYISDELHDRLILISQTLEEIGDMELEFSDVKSEYVR